MTEYDRGFKEGVTRATEQLYVNSSHVRYSGWEANEKLKDRRKNLLTKKVTKWINIWKIGPYVSSPSSVLFGTGILYDDKPTAEANVIHSPCGDFLGTYPIEVETEI